jgi:F0F1-type ATP synthase assembly protein I
MPIKKIKQKLAKTKIDFAALDEALELGFTIALPPVLLAFLGLFLDKVFHSRPTLTIIFIFAGAFLGMFTAAKEIKDILKKIKPPFKK